MKNNLEETNNNSQESSRVEKLDEMPDYETTNEVVEKGNRIPSNSSDSRTHPDSFNTPFEPVKQKKCQAYYRMPESMKKVLCQYCDMYGRVRTEFGIGVCRRYEE